MLKLWVYTSRFPSLRRKTTRQFSAYNSVDPRLQGCACCDHLVITLIGFSVVTVTKTQDQSRIELACEWRCSGTRQDFCNHRSKAQEQGFKPQRGCMWVHVF